jgi:hypothetical protein
MDNFRQGSIKKGEPMSKKAEPRARAHKVHSAQYKLGIFPKTEAEWVSLANDIYDWAHLETSFALEDFPLSRGYSPHKFYKWEKHNEYFADTLEFARYMVGSRRERAARERRVDSTIILKTMPLYNLEFKELTMDKISKHQESRPYTIIMQEYTSPLVPAKPDDGITQKRSN